MTSVPAAGAASDATNSAWTGRAAPTLAEVEALADLAFARLPAGFRRLCDGVVVRVEDFPDEATQEEMDCGEFDLLGLFRGVGLAQGGGAAALATGQLPNMVWLYRRPLLDHWAERGDVAFDRLVAHVLVHEIGHHFGLSDADMAGIEAGVAD